MGALDFIPRFGLLLVYFASLNIAYLGYFKPASSEQYYEVNWVIASPYVNATAVAWLLATALCALASTCRRRPSELFLVVLLMTPILPMLAIYANKGAYTEYVLFVALMYLVVFAVARLPRGARQPDLIPLKRFLSEEGLLLACLGMVAAFFVFEILVGNLAYLNFDFARVYEFRRLAAAQRGDILGYLESNLTTLVLGFAAVLALHQKRYFVLFLLFVASIYIFGFTAHRGHFVVVAFSLMFYFVIRTRRPFVWIVGGAIVLCLASAAIYQLDPRYNLFNDAVVGRPMFTTAYMNFFYYDFFSQNPKMWWADSRVSFGLVQNPYDLTAPRVIYDHFTGTDLSGDANYGNANTGFLGAGFGHGGYLGMFIYAIFVGMIIRLADNLADLTSPAVAFGGLSYMMVAALFLSADVPTILLSHGLLLTLLLVGVMRRKDMQRPAPSQAAASSDGIVVTRAT